MEVSELLSSLSVSQSPVGFLLTVVLIIATISGLVSKAAADYGGVFGAAARAIQQHKQEAIEADKASDARRLDRLETTIERLDAELCNLQSRDRVHHEYQLYVAGYWRKLQFWAVEEGVTLPPPPMMTYPEWKEATYPVTEQPDE